MKNWVIVCLALSMVLVGCSDHTARTAKKEKQESSEELNIKAKDYIKFKNTHTLGSGTFYSITPFGSDLLGVSDLSLNDDGKRVVEKIDSEGNSKILFQVPSALKEKEYDFDSITLLRNGSYLLNGWSLRTVDHYQVERKELFIIGPDNKLKSIISLPSEVITIYKTAMLNSNEFLVSVQKDNGMNFIQKIDKKGNTLKEVENASSFILTKDNKVVVINGNSGIVFDSNLNELSRLNLRIADESGKTKYYVTSLMNAPDGSIILGFDVYHIDTANPDEAETVDIELVSISVEGNVNWRKVVAKKSVSIPNSLVEYNGNYVISALKEHDGAEKLYVFGAYSKDGKELGKKYIKGGFSTFNQLSVIGDKLFNVSTKRGGQDTFHRVMSEISFEELVK